MSLIRLRASLVLWRARFRWRDQHWKHWKKVGNKPETAKWERLRLEAIDRINQRKEQIADLAHPKPKPAGPIQMFDSVDVGMIPQHAQAVAGYTSGNWPTFPELVRKFPRARRLSIAVNAAHDADCLDVENGDATPGQAPGWARRQIARGLHKPVLYTSISNAPALVATMTAAGINRGSYRLWTAHYTGGAHICSPHTCAYNQIVADATQWTDKALGRNLDESLVAPGFF